MAANFIDDRGWVVFLFLGRKAVVVLQAKAPLILAGVLALLFARLRDGRNQFRFAPPIARRFVKRLSFRVQRMVPSRLLIRRIEDGLLEEWAGRRRHTCARPLWWG